MRKLPVLSGAAALVLASTPAFAHHAMGGATASTLSEGLISGLAHPVIGLDHLAFILAMGIAAAFTPRPLLSPLAFVAATVAGCALLLSGVTLPLVEIVVTGSAVLVGAMVLSGRTFAPGLWLALFAAAGLFHGWAYGESILGAEATPLAAYLIGFAAIQYALAVGAGWVVRKLWRATDPAALNPRLAGAVMAGIGFAFLMENIEGMLFAV